MSETIKVKMADYRICKPDDKITTIGLGSCVGIVVYDKNTKICGMLHAMLPDSTKISNNANRAKFVDTGMEDMMKELLLELKKAGSVRARLSAKVAGGASMFDFEISDDNTGVGAQNAKAAREVLKKYKIPMAAEDTGGKNGRTIVFDPQTEKLNIKYVGKAETFI